MASEIFAVRGAIAPVANTTDGVHEAATELLGTILSRNHLRTDSIIFAFFTVTPDLNAAFPAAAARAMGWDSVPMMCGVEIPVQGALAGCIRVLLLCRTPARTRRPKGKAARSSDRVRAGAPAPAATRRGQARAPGHKPVHVYLGEAAALRPDLAGPAGSRGRSV